jgi:hypothetical protein
MHDITLQPIAVITDGGSQDGRLVLADGQLAAVVARVSGEDTAGEEYAEGWFMEAGFGPCGRLSAVQPPVFPSLDEATRWVRERLEEHG